MVVATRLSVAMVTQATYCHDDVVACDDWRLSVFAVIRRRIESLISHY